MTHRAFAVGFIGLLAVGCGARSFEFEVGNLYPDATAISVDAGTVADATTPKDAAPETGNGPGAGGGLLGGDSGIVQCGSCLTTTCLTDITACVADTSCTGALPCIAQNCLSGNIIACGTTCNLLSNPNTLNLATCVLLKCPACTSALGGLGGLLGGGGIPGLPLGGG